MNTKKYDFFAAESPFVFTEVTYEVSGIKGKGCCKLHTLLSIYILRTWSMQPHVICYPEIAAIKTGPLCQMDRTDCDDMKCN